MVLRLQASAEEHPQGAGKGAGGQPGADDGGGVGHGVGASRDDTEADYGRVEEHEQAGRAALVEGNGAGRRRFWACMHMFKEEGLLIGEIGTHSRDES